MSQWPGVEMCSWEWESSKRLCSQQSLHGLFLFNSPVLEFLTHVIEILATHSYYKCCSLLSHYQGCFCSHQHIHKFPVRIGVWQIWGSSVSLWQNMSGGGGGLAGLWATVFITVLHNIWHFSSCPYSRTQVATCRPPLRAIKQVNNNKKKALKSMCWKDQIQKANDKF